VEAEGRERYIFREATVFGGDFFAISVGDENFHIPKIPTLGLMRRLSEVEYRVKGLPLDDQHRNMEYIAGFLCAVLGKDDEWVDNLSLPEAMKAIQKITDAWSETDFFPPKERQTEAEGQVNTGG